MHQFGFLVFLFTGLGFFSHYPHGVYFIRINHKRNRCVIMWVTDFSWTSPEKDLASYHSKHFCTALERLSCKIIEDTNGKLVHLDVVACFYIQSLQKTSLSVDDVARDSIFAI